MMTDLLLLLKRLRDCPDRNVVVVWMLTDLHLLLLRWSLRDHPTRNVEAASRACAAMKVGAEQQTVQRRGVFVQVKVRAARQGGSAQLLLLQQSAACVQTRAAL